MRARASTQRRRQRRQSSENREWRGRRAARAGCPFVFSSHCCSGAPVLSPFGCSPCRGVEGGPQSPACRRDAPNRLVWRATGCPSYPFWRRARGAAAQRLRGPCRHPDVAAWCANGRQPGCSDWDPRLRRATANIPRDRRQRTTGEACCNRGSSARVALATR